MTLREVVLEGFLNVPPTHVVQIIPITERSAMSEGFLETVKKAIRDYRQERFQSKQALKGYTDGLNEIQYVDLLSDADLVRLNRMLKWNCFTVDRHGRRFGNAASAEKRSDH